MVQQLRPVFAQAPNYALLDEELATALSVTVDDVGCGYDGAYYVVVPDGVLLSTIQVVVDAHIHTDKTSSQSNQIATDLLLIQGKAYLYNKLNSTNPNITTIYSVLKAVIDGDAILTQLLNNQLALMENSFGWTVDLVTPTTIDKQRYIIILEMVISLLT